MKKFTLTAKRAKKVLALALAAALIVPAIPSQQVDADVEHYVPMPKAVADYKLDSADEFVAAGTTGKAIQFTGEAVKATLTSVATGGAQYQSTDKTPVKEGGNYVYDNIDVTPEIIDDAVRGKVLSLKENVSVPQYPAGATYEGDIIQKSAKYYSAVEIANPFVAERDALYDASRYTFDKVYATGTEEDRIINDTYSDRFAVYKNRFSAPAAKAGVTLSFWTTLPYDESASAPATTNFVEFHNNETVIYKTDDLAKNWIAEQYVAAAAAGTASNADSPFFPGEVKEATIVAVNANATSSFPDIDGSDVGTAMKYVENYGMYAKWNPATAEIAMANNSGQLKCWVINAINQNAAAGNKEIVVDLGEGNYGHLKWSDTVYAEGDANGLLEKFKSSEENPFGAYTTYTEGSTGILALGSLEQVYNRDYNKTGIQQNTLNANAGTLQNMQHNTTATVQADGTVTGSLMNVADNDTAANTWHYVTYVITDEWIQTYVDGKAVDPDKVTAWNGNTFNQGSSMYAPNGKFANSNARSDWQKISNDDMTGSIYGQLFGESVMSYITDPNTKLYIGGKDQNTYAGTLIDSIAFYSEAFSRAQVEKERLERQGEIDPLFTCGDVNEDEIIDANDALEVLKKVANMEVAVYNEAAADTNNDSFVNANDALNILKYVANLIDKLPVEN